MPVTIGVLALQVGPCMPQGESGMRMCGRWGGGDGACLPAATLRVPSLLWMPDLSARIMRARARMQGDFQEHIATFNKCKTEVTCVEVRKTEQLDGLDGLGSLSVLLVSCFLLLTACVGCVCLSAPPPARLDSASPWFA